MKESNLLKPFILCLAALLTASCGGGGGGGGGGGSATTLDVTVNLPAEIATLPSGTATLSIGQTGDTPVDITITGSTETYTFTGLSSGLGSANANYDLIVTFESSLYPGSPLTVATASVSVTINSGSNTLTASVTDFDTNMDEDSDGRLNLAEFSNGTNPFLPLCILNSSTSGLLNSCEL